MSMLKNFTVVDLIQTRSASVATLTGNYIKFNNQTAAELHYPAYVQLLISTKDKQFAIRACKEDAPNAVPFSKPKAEQKTPVKIGTIAITDIIRKMAGWKPEENWNVPGVYFAQDAAIIYDVKAATRPVSKGGGWGVKKQREAEAAGLVRKEVER